MGSVLNCCRPKSLTHLRPSALQAAGLPHTSQKRHWAPASAPLSTTQMRLRRSVCTPPVLVTPDRLHDHCWRRRITQFLEPAPVALNATFEKVPALEAWLPGFRRSRFSPRSAATGCSALSINSARWQLYMALERIPSLFAQTVTFMSTAPQPVRAPRGLASAPREAVVLD